VERRTIASGRSSPGGTSVSAALSGATRWVVVVVMFGAFLG
jgi:hypothetical protein